jgi:dethiobiotin synthetase
MKGFTIVGTQTDCGKTFTACTLLERYNAQGLQTVGFKPVASGGIWTEGKWQYSDTRLLQQASSIACTEKEITPFSYKAAISPHFAAMIEGRPQCSWEGIEAAHRTLCNKNPDVIIVETSGGLLSPLSEDLTCLDVCVLLQHPVILVVEIMLGCLNTAQLSHRCLIQSKVPYAGWIANHKHPTLDARYAILQDLSKRLHAPPLLHLTPHAQKATCIF